jgi:hypothetical protein
MKRAKHLCASLIALGCPADVMVQYGDRVSVACGRTTAGNWLQFPGFCFDGSVLPDMDGQVRAPWRGGPKLDAWEAALKVEV